MQASILNIIGMAVICVPYVLVLIAPYVLLRSLELRSRAKFIILALTAACAIVSWELALYFLLAAVAPAFVMYFLHKRDSAKWLPIAISPLPAVIALLVMLAMFSSNLSVLIAEMLDAFYSQDTNISGMTLPARDELNSAIDSVIQLSPALVYVSVAIVFYFTERAYYAPREARRLNNGARRHNNERVIMPMPDFFIGLLLVSLLSMALTYVMVDNKLLSAIGMNGLVIVASLYFFRGLDIVRYYLARLNISPFFIVAIYMLLLIYWPMVMPVAVLGFASVYINLIRDENEKQA